MAVLASWRNAGLDLFGLAKCREMGAEQGWPEGDRETVRERRRAAVAWDLGEEAALGMALDALARADIPVLVIKGAAVARTYYPQSWARPRGDADLLVPDGALARAADTLVAAGFREACSQAALTGQRHFDPPGPWGGTLDVHERLFVPDQVATGITWDDLARDARPIPGLGSCALAPAAPHALWIACLHRVLHHNDSERPVWLLDIALVAAALDAEAWARFARVARETRTAQVCASSLRRASDLFGVSLPADGVAALDAERGEPSAAFLGGHLTEWRLQRMAFARLRSWRARAAFVRAHLFPPAAYMRAQPGGDGGWLPWLYAVRVLRGWRKWWRPIARQ